jgi:hypothetical protein
MGIGEQFCWGHVIGKWVSVSVSLTAMHASEVVGVQRTGVHTPQQTSLSLGVIVYRSENVIMLSLKPQGLEYWELIFDGHFFTAQVSQRQLYCLSSVMSVIELLGEDIAMYGFHRKDCTRGYVGTVTLQSIALGFECEVRIWAGTVPLVAPRKFEANSLGKSSGELTIWVISLTLRLSSNIRCTSGLLAITGLMAIPGDTPEFVPYSALS